MQIRFSAGTEVLRIADIVSTAKNLGPLSVEGALLVFDFGDADLDASITKIAAMDAALGDQILEADEANIQALTALKQTLADVERDVCREFAARDAVGTVVEATATDTSHPTGTGDAATSNAPTQQSVEQNEEIVSEPVEPEQQPRKRRG